MVQRLAGAFSHTRHVAPRAGCCTLALLIGCVTVALGWLLLLAFDLRRAIRPAAAAGLDLSSGKFRLGWLLPLLSDETLNLRLGRA